MPAAKNRICVTESSFAQGQEALEFVRAHLSTQELYSAWTNFEFITNDGSINEVGLLVFTPHGFFLIEIKSRPGRLFGGAEAWTWDTKGRPLATCDNPLILANTKSKKLRSLPKKTTHNEGEKVVTTGWTLEQNRAWHPPARSRRRTKKNAKKKVAK
ncbi:NERD domain-containing protein [Mariniblastus sp.]|nr:NERD domain-containing protein [Mariniblastus sp.]